MERRWYMWKGVLSRRRRLATREWEGAGGVLAFWGGQGSAGCVMVDGEDHHSGQVVIEECL